MQMFRNIYFSASYYLFKMTQKCIPLANRDMSVISTKLICLNKDVCNLYEAPPLLTKQADSSPDVKLSRFPWTHTTVSLGNWIKQINNRQNGIPKLPTMAVIGFLWSKPKEKVEKTDENISMVIEKADKEYDNGHYEDCYHILLKSKYDDNVEVKWRMCRALYNLAKETKYDHKYRKELITEAYEIISNELPRSRDNYAVHKWYALVLEAKSSNIGYKEKIKNLEKIKEELDFAVALNPNDATTLYMLGEWCYQLTDMPWHYRKTAEILFSPLPHSCYEDALEYFLRAESVQPRFYSLNLLRIGSCYLKLNKEDQAKYYLHLAASYPAKSNEDHQANKEATDLLKKMS